MKCFENLKKPWKGLFVGSPIIVGIIVGLLTMDTNILGTILFFGLANPSPLPPIINIIIPSFIGAIGCIFTGILVGVN